MAAQVATMMRDPVSLPSEEWYVARIRQQLEVSVARQLAWYGYETYSPRVHQGGRDLPMFTGYMFVAAPPDDVGWGRAIWTPGVIEFLGGRRPAPVPPTFVPRLRAEGLIHLNRVGKIMREFVTGDLARICDPDSPLQGERGRVVWSEAGKVRLILMGLLGGAGYIIPAERLIHEEED